MHVVTVRSRRPWPLSSYFSSYLFIFVFLLKAITFRWRASLNNQDPHTWHSSARLSLSLLLSTSSSSFSSFSLSLTCVYHPNWSYITASVYFFLFACRISWHGSNTVCVYCIVVYIQYVERTVSMSRRNLKFHLLLFCFLFSRHFRFFHFSFLKILLPAHFFSSQFLSSDEFKKRRRSVYSPLVLLCLGTLGCAAVWQQTGIICVVIYMIVCLLVVCLLVL